MTRIILALVILILALILPCACQENEAPQIYINESYSNQIALDIYLDESGKALVAGYVENPEMLSDLDFLKDTQYSFDNQTYQLICITDKLTWKQAENWRINLSIQGYFTEYSATIYFPKTASLSKIEISKELSYYVNAENESVVVVVHGFDTGYPGFGINYRLSVSQPQQNVGQYVLIFIAVLAAIGFGFWRWRTGLEEKAEADSLAEEELALPGSEIALTPEMQKVIETLSENERQVVNALINNRGKLTQAKIRHETGIPKSSLTGIIYALERKKIVSKTKYGRTNVIELSTWFLNRNK